MRNRCRKQSSCYQTGFGVYGERCWQNTGYGRESSEQLLRIIDGEIVDGRAQLKGPQIRVLLAASFLAFELRQSCLHGCDCIKKIAYKEHMRLLDRFRLEHVI